MSEPTNHDDTAGASERPAPEKKPACTRSLAFQLAALGLIVVSGLAGTGLAVRLQSPKAVAPSILSPRLFAGWEKPDLVLVVSGEQHGYLLPCGCSHPPERRIGTPLQLDRGDSGARLARGRRRSRQCAADYRPLDCPMFRGLSNTSTR